MQFCIMVLLLFNVCPQYFSECLTISMKRGYNLVQMVNFPVTVTNHCEICNMFIRHAELLDLYVLTHLYYLHAAHQSGLIPPS